MSDAVTPQKANPGGNLAPEQVVGRDDFIAELWETLERQSARITAERRMGKTSILKKMRAEAPLGTTVIYRSFEPVRTVQEFLELVLQDVAELLPTRLRASQHLRSVVQALNISLEAGPVHLDPQLRRSWKDVIESVLTAIDDAEGRVVFLWDEVPVMVGAIADAEGPAAAQDLLNALRTSRQRCESIRMVFTGSIGLHHVLGTLRSGTYSNAPVNDMRLTELAGLDRRATTELTRRLLAGENLRADDETFVNAMHDATSGIPFYIQQVVARLSSRSERLVTTSDIEDVIDEAVHSGLDKWEFGQYRSRIADYYGERERLALTVLDAVAVTPRPMTFEGLLNAARAQAPADAEDLRDVLELLEKDHYIRWQDERCAFSFGIVGRAWKAMRHL